MPDTEGEVLPLKEELTEPDCEVEAVLEVLKEGLGEGERVAPARREAVAAPREKVARAGDGEGEAEGEAGVEGEPEREGELLVLGEVEALLELWGEAEARGEGVAVRQPLAEPESLAGAEA